jgi:hypothetical protein
MALNNPHWLNVLFFSTFGRFVECFRLYAREKTDADELLPGSGVDSQTRKARKNTVSANQTLRSFILIISSASHIEI